MDYAKISRLFLFLVPFTVLIVVSDTLFPFIVGKYSFFRGMVLAALVMFCVELLVGGKSEFYWRRLVQIIKSPLSIAVMAFGLVYILAGVFGVNPHFSFWSNFERGEGGFQILILVVYFLLLRTLFTQPSHWRKFFWLSIIAAGLMTLYGIFAALKFIDYNPQNPTLSGPFFKTFYWAIGPGLNEANFRFSGSIGNPSYTGAYMLFILFYAFYLLGVYRLKQKKHLVNLLAFVSVISVFVLFLANTRGTFIGFFAGLAVAALYLAYAKKRFRKLILISFLTVSILLSLGFAFKNTKLVKSLPGSRLFQISLNAKTFGDRVIMWKIAWAGFEQRPLLGWGPENYLENFERNYQLDYFKPTQGFGAWFDRAHSMIFDYLAATGVLGLLSYLSIYVVLGIALFKSIKSKVKEGQGFHVLVNALLIALFVSYLVQGLVLFEVLTVYYNLFAALAFAGFYFAQTKENRLTVQANV